MQIVRPEKTYEAVQVWTNAADEVNEFVADRLAHAAEFTPTGIIVWIKEKGQVNVPYGAYLLCDEDGNISILENTDGYIVGEEEVLVKRKWRK